MIDSCIFCDIVHRQAPASRVYEDAHTLAFMNRRQANPGHVLVIPKAHVPMIYDLDPEAAAHLAQTIVKVSRAIRRAVQPDGLSIWQSNDVAAGQEVFHVHFHLFPRRTADPFLQFYPEMPDVEPRPLLDQLAARIREGRR